jgi:enoyl-CoA hydratase/carnithine racemase
VLAAESARFTMAYSKIAATPDGSSSYFLPRLIASAARSSCTTRPRAVREGSPGVGPVTRVIADGEFAGAVRSFAKNSRRGPRARSAARSCCSTSRRPRASRPRWSWRPRPSRPPVAPRTSARRAGLRREEGAAFRGDEDPREAPMKPRVFYRPAEAPAPRRRSSSRLGGSSSTR